MTLYSPGGLNLADTSAPLILGYDDTGLTDVVFAVSASGDLTVTPDGADVSIAGTLSISSHVILDPTQKLYLDGGGNTFISESAADTISLTTGGTQRWNVTSTGHLLAEGDNNYDIGASGANRPRDVFIAGTTTVGGSATIGTAASSLTRDFTLLSDAPRILMGTGAAKSNWKVAAQDSLEETWTVAKGATTDSDPTDDTFTDLLMVSSAAVTIVPPLTVTGAVTASSTLAVTGISTLTGNIKVGANIGGTSNGGAYTIWGGNDTLNGGWIQLYGSTHASTAKVIIAGGPVQVSDTLAVSGAATIGTAASTLTRNFTLLSDAPRILMGTGASKPNWKMAAQDSVDLTWTVAKGGTNDSDPTDDTFTDLLMVSSTAVTVVPDFTASGDVIIGTNPASAGDIRINKNFKFFVRNADNSGDRVVMGENAITGAGTLDIGDNTSGRWDCIAFHAGALNTLKLEPTLITAAVAVTVTGTLSATDITASGDVIIGTNPSSAGDIRINKDFQIFTRNNANDANKAIISENVFTGNDTLDFGDNGQWAAMRFHVSTLNVMELTSSAINLNKAVTMAGTLDVTSGSYFIGNIGIGTDHAAPALTVLETTATQKVALFDNNHASTPYGVYIDYSGATPNNAAYPFIQCEDATAVRLNIWSNGNIVNANDSYGGISDERLKTDIAPARSQWEDVKWLGANAINYRFLVDGDDAHTLLGWGAQSVEAAGMGGLVELAGEDETYTLKTSIIHTKAVIALGEALVRIEALEEALAAL